MNTETNQTQQITSNLEPVSVIQSRLNPQANIQSGLGAITPIVKRYYYNGSISTNDWVQVGNYWYYKVAHGTHKLSAPYVSKFLVASAQGYDNAFYSYTVFANKDVKFRSSMPVDCEYTIMSN